MSTTEQLVIERVKQWEAAWNLGSEPFSMKRFGDLYVRDESPVLSVSQRPQCLLDKLLTL